MRTGVKFGDTPLSGRTQTGVSRRGSRLFGVANENNRGRRLRLEEPRESDRDRRVNDDDLDAAAPALAAAILVRYVVAHGTRLYEVFLVLTTPYQPGRSCRSSITT